MAVEITLRLGSVTPTSASGITMGEPAYNTVDNRLFVGKGYGITAAWVGAPISNDYLQIAAGLTQQIPTLGAVKDYVNYIGTIGATGSQGATGATGSQGATGATGSQGATGATGSQGISGAISFTSSTTAPAGATYGDMWFNTTSGNVFVYITDGTSSYWVEPFGPQGATGSQGNTGAAGAIPTDYVVSVNGQTGAIEYIVDFKRGWFLS